MVKSIFLKVLTIPLFLFSISWTLKSLAHIVSTTAPDFSVLWYAARDLVRGTNPYTDTSLFTGVGYPPNTLLYYLPLNFFSYEVAQFVFISLAFFSIPVVVFLSLKTIKKFDWFVFLLFTSLALLAFPTKFTLGMGQNNTIALLLLLLSLYTYKQKPGSKIVPGIFLGLSIGLKTIFGYFLLFYIVKREWKLIISSLAVFSSLVVLVYALSNAGVDLYKFYIKEVIPPLLDFQGREIYYNQGIVGFISRLTTDISLRKIVGIFTSILLIILSVSKSRTERYPIELQFSFYVTVLLLIDSLSWQHHFVWLIPPFIILTAKSIQEKNRNLLTAILFSYLLISWNFKEPSRFATFPLNLVLSHAFYGTLILFFVNFLFLLPRKYRDKISRCGFKRPTRAIVPI